MPGLIQTIEHPWEPVGDQVISDLSAAVGLTVPAGAVYALIQAQTKAVMLRDSGSDPTASAGLKLTADGAPYFYTGDLAAVKVIEVEASASLFVSYYCPRRHNVELG